ncbi:hypothetical protein AYK20_03545 [Thermoplasmatales archaeon SG8-52-1]|nr:MAG: hypothetical protein AYK20_03545 [Thermoplasmatales archaeon SG8-52-1]
MTTFIQASNAEEKKSLNSKIIFNLEFDLNDFEFDKFNGYDRIMYPDGGLITELGKPLLPLKNILVAVPNEMIATNIKILELEKIKLPSIFNIMPAQAPQKVGTRANIQFVKNEIDYIELYPSNVVKLNGMTDFAGQGITILTIYPLQYNPTLKTLKLIKNIKIQIECEIGYTCGDYLPNSVTKADEILYREKVKEMVVNPKDVVLQKNQDFQPLGDKSENYDYIIITKNDWVSAFQSLADWKTQKGVPANIVTTEDIYANFSGSTNQEKIRAFIQDAHSSWGSTFFLLGGDTDTIPYKSIAYLGDNIPSDTYYSDYDDDWICEVNVGRASVNGTGNGTGKIGNFISKTLSYEKNPPTTSFAKNVSLFGFDLDWTTEGEDCKIDIDDLYIPSNWTVTKIYDSHDGNHEDNVDLAVNSGQNLMNHIDHSGQYYMGTGYTNHNWGLDTSEVDNFSNGNKQGTWYSIGCWASAIDYDNCIAEHFVRDSDGGGIAFVGNTRYGWYYVGGDDLASLRYDRYFFQSFFIQNHFKLGELFSDHKNDAYFSWDQNDYNKYIFTELTLLGDPELPIWMENPSSFDVTHDSEILVGSSSFTVHVEDSLGGNIQNAFVCLWKDDEVYLTNYTDGSGDITFDISPSTEGNMSVTVTKKDYIPYENNVNVLLNQAPNIPSDPNPSHGATEVSINTILSWHCSDPEGDPLTFDVYFGSFSPPPLVSSNQTTNSYDPGTLDFETTYYWMIVAWDDNGASAQSPVWRFTTGINNPPNAPSNPHPANDSTNIPIDTNLSWVCGDPDGDIVAFDVYFGPVNPPPLVANNVTEYDPGLLEINTTYYWKIVAWDEYGASSAGDIWRFTTVPNQAPEPPNIEGPPSGKAGIEYCITVHTNGQDGDDFMYIVDWGDDSTSGWLGPYQQGEPIEICHTYLFTGYYNIRAKAKDIYGTESEWSDPFSVNIPRIKSFIFKLDLINHLSDKFPILYQLLKLVIQH